MHRRARRAVERANGATLRALVVEFETHGRRLRRDRRERTGRGR
jgi:hypothetical protein